MRHALRALLAALAAAVVAAAEPAAADPYADAIDALRAELEARHAALVGATGRGARQRAGIEKALAAMDRPSDSLGADLKIASTIVKNVERQYTDEIAAGGQLATLFTAVLAPLEGEVADLREDCEEFASVVSNPRQKARIEAALAKADARLAGIPGAPSFVKHAALLTKSLSSVLTCQRLTSRALPDVYCMLEEDGTHLVMAAKFTSAFFNRGLGYFSFQTAQAGGNGRLLDLVIDHEFTGTGTYGAGTASPVSGDWGYGYCPSADVVYPECRIVDPTSATVTVTALDATRHTIRGTFSFTATGSLGTVTVTKGSFQVRGDAFDVDQ